MKSRQAQKVDNNLKNALDKIVQNKAKYVRDYLVNFTRTRKLSMKNTMIEILSMGGESLSKEMQKFYEVNNIELTPSAFVQQRSKIHASAFRDLFYEFNNVCEDAKTYKGYRILAVDGSDIDCPRNSNSPNFVPNFENSKGFNKIHLNAIYDVLNKTYVDVFLQPYCKQDEQGALSIMVKNNRFVGKNLIMTDRGYEGYNTLVHLHRTPNVDCLCRVKNGKGSMRFIKNIPLDEYDIDISDEITTTQTNEDKKHNRILIQTASKKGKVNSPKTRVGRWDFESPYRFTFRVVTFRLETGEYETIITSLNREEFPASEIKKLYHLRWGIETSFRELKYTVGLVNLHSKKDELIEQEIYAALTMYNYCSRIAGSIEIKKSKKRKYDYKVNYTLAVSTCKRFFRKQEEKCKKLIEILCKYTVPIRPDRRDKRNIKLKGFVGFTYRVAA